jgi:hypothetical protein
MDRKKIMQMLLLVFVAVIFLTAYASFDSFNSQQQQTSSTTSVVPSTAYASGFANATLSGYENITTVSVTCKAASPLTLSLQSALSGLEANSSVLSYYQSQGQFIIENGNMPVPAFYSYLMSGLNATSRNCTSVLTGINAVLPQVISLEVAGQSYQIPVPEAMRARTVQLPALTNLSVKVPLKISALLTVNGTLYELNATSAE